MKRPAIALACLMGIAALESAPGSAAELVPYNPPRASKSSLYGTPQQAPVYEVPQQMPAYPAQHQVAPPLPQVQTAPKPAVTELSPDETRKVDQLAAEVRKLGSKDQIEVRDGIKRQLNEAVNAGDLRQIRYYDRLLQKIEFTK